MCIIGHGIDLVDNARIALVLSDHPERFLERVFTETEQHDAGMSKRRIEHLAARFAAKEATFKALGTGWSWGIAWTDVSIVKKPSGKPELIVTGRAVEIAKELGITHWHVSLTHTSTAAMASVIAEGP